MATVSDAKRLVVKIGSALLVDRASGDLRGDWLRSLAEDVARLRARGTDVILVSSGSIALGRGVLGLPAKELTLEQSQAAAAVGQIKLAGAYDTALALHGLKAAQVLVTLEDSADRRRYLNFRATLEQLLQLGVVPIVNENDTVATDEIRYGDNDRMAAQVAVTAGADQLILLSDVDGFYSANPAQDATARRFDVIDAITPEIEAMAGDAGSGLSKGGMKTKLMAAKTAIAAGCDMAITEGSVLHPILALENGASVTWFNAQGDPQQKRKAWIAAMKPKGRVTVDAGAARALRAGSSLLPAGVTQVSGLFGRGDAVQVVDAAGHGLGQGLTRYDAADAEKIKGLRSQQIEPVLGYPARGPLMHRDDMAF
ncbi:Glutamate 5-kinase [Roseovarius litorisediminis]|uniref:Glutamate 5-kinase n=1 Tax=Roseovarius litorisediminis TaxID=1312363 RepID=A0A1Y5R7R3_9RHOB|nr:glutamate 5-kinase [Roseovarius litorisediminis]SLN11128.1 Glutamate 5-kinase [Roseovarius litorisediminis]